MSATNEATGTAKDQAGAVAQTTKDQAGAVAQTTKDQAANVAGTAGQAAKEVAGTAKEQASTVASEVTTQARDLLGETREQVRAQAETQTQRLAQTVRSLAGELTGMANGTNDRPGPATDVARQVADRAHGVASYLESAAPEQLLADLRDFARRRTGLFLFSAGAAGFLASRLAKAASANSADSADRVQYGQPQYGQPQYSARPAASYAAPVSSGLGTPALGATTETHFYGEPAVEDPSPSPRTSAMAGGVEYGTGQTSVGGDLDYPLPSDGAGGIRPVDPILDDERGQR